MKSYTQGRNYYGVLTKNTGADNLALGDQVANDDYRALCALHDWPFLEKLRTLTTVGSQEGYVLPYDCDQVREIAVIVSSYRYTPTLAPSQKFWDQLNETSYTSDIPEYYYVFDGEVKLWPTPSTTGSTINVTQKTRVIDLSIADYTTGTIVEATNGSADIVGATTAWTSQMVGRYIRITYADGAKTGDGLWYEIAGVTDATHLTLVRKYGGVTIASATAAYTLGQMPLLPEAFHDLPWIWGAGQYWMKENDKRGANFLTVHGNIGSGRIPSTGRVKILEKVWTSPTTSLVIDDGGRNEILNPNTTITITP